MKAVALAFAVLLGGCVVYSQPAYRPPPPPSSAAPASGITQEQAIEIAFGVARDRGLDVDRVQHVNLDQAGRWHVDVRGRGDRALVLLDARDGRLLKGRFKARGGADPGDETWDD